ELDERAVTARCDSLVFRRGLLQADNATLQPARLALGLRAALLERGVRIHESSPVVRFREGPPVEAVTAGGTVRADRGVLALGAWSASLPAFRRSIVPRGTYIVITEPAPDRLAEIGWTAGEGLADWRIALGAAAATAGAGVGLGPRLRYDPPSIVKLVDDFRRFFPSWADVRF